MTVRSEHMKTVVKDAMKERDAEQAAEAARFPLQTLDEVRALTPEQINERWEEVAEVLENDRPEIDVFDRHADTEEETS